jgi:RimJ/RimL family protein N-acetyltransferase
VPPSEAERATPLSLTIQPLRRPDARIISTWHYPEPYAVYDLNMRVPMLVQQVFLFLGQSIYFAAYASAAAVACEPPVDAPPSAAPSAGAETLVGFFSFVPRGAIVDIGVALRPDLTGRGLGLGFVLAGLEFATERFKPAAFRLDVAVFNQRARRVYERARFRAGRTVYRRMRSREYECIEMVRDA